MKRIKLIRELEQTLSLLPDSPQMASVRLKSILTQIQIQPTLINRFKNWLGL